MRTRAPPPAAVQVAAAPADCGGKNALTAEGSTAQKNAIGEFNKVWGQACPGKSLGYNATGSGPGRTQFINKQVDFAGSDSPLGKDQIDPAAKRCEGNPAWNLPLVFGPIAMAYNLSGVDKLVLNADVLAKIYTGGITTWNDKAIAALNRGVTLPDTKVTPDQPQGLFGHQRQLPEIPRCRGSRRPGPRAPVASSRASAMQLTGPRVSLRRSPRIPVPSATSRRASLTRPS